MRKIIIVLCLIIIAANSCRMADNADKFIGLIEKAAKP